MLRLAFIACALVASTICAARPMVIVSSQTLEPPEGSGYYFFGAELAIDGDWAIVTGATYSTSPSNPTQAIDTLLYHRVNGKWTLDRTLAHRVATYPDQYQFLGVAMNNGVAVIGANPTRIFKRTNNSWAQIAHPFTAPQSDPDFVSGEFLWDGNTLLATQNYCIPAQKRPWGARISTLNPDGSWTPLERLSSGDVSCLESPVNWGISGNTVIVTSYPDVSEVSEDMRVFRRSGLTWQLAAVLSGGFGEGDVRGNDLFLASSGPLGTLVLQNDNGLAITDHIRTVITSYRESGPAFGFTHTDDVFMQGRDLFRKNAAGRYEHAATIAPRGNYILVGKPKINGRRLISQVYGDFSSSNQAVTIFDLPSTYTHSPVIATGFENAAPPITPQLGTFAVATAANGNHVYRQSSLAGDYRALLGNSDWVEQSIEADIKPTAFSGTDRWAGLAVRYLDAGNYYYLTLRSSGVVALKRMRNGAISTLAQKSLPIVVGRNYHVALQASGQLLRVLVDGTELFYSFDSEIAHGSAALVGYRAAADYDNIVAAQAGQRPIFDQAFDSCQGPLNSSGYWALNSGGAWGCSRVADDRIIQQTAFDSGDANAVVGTPTDDQVVMARARATTFGAGQDRWFGITARYVDASNYYYLSVRNSNTVSLRKLVNGSITVLGTAALSVKANTWYDLRLDIVGNELRAFVNGSQVLQATDSSHASGQGGVLTYRTAAEYATYRAWQP
jgi:hypothetical protein